MYGSALPLEIPRSPSLLQAFHGGLCCQCHQTSCSWEIIGTRELLNAVAASAPPSLFRESSECRFSRLEGPARLCLGCYGGRWMCPWWIFCKNSHAMHFVDVTIFCELHELTHQSFQTRTSRESIAHGTMKCTVFVHVKTAFYSNRS